MALKENEEFLLEGIKLTLQGLGIKYLLVDEAGEPSGTLLDEWFSLTARKELAERRVAELEAAKETQPRKPRGAHQLATPAKYGLYEVFKGMSPMETRTFTIPESGELPIGRAVEVCSGVGRNLYGNGAFSVRRVDNTVMGTRLK